VLKVSIYTPGVWDIPIGFLSALNFFVVFARPDDTSRAGEKPDCRQAGFVFLLRFFLPQSAPRNYARLND